MVLTINDSLRVNRQSNLKDIGSLDETHERKETSIGPAMDGNTAQVHKVKLLCYILQPLHLVFNLYLTLERQTELFRLELSHHIYSFNDTGLLLVCVKLYHFVFQCSFKFKTPLTRTPPINDNHSIAERSQRVQAEVFHALKRVVNQLHLHIQRHNHVLRNILFTQS